MSAVLDAPGDAFSLAENVFELMPHPVLVLDSKLLLSRANAKARAWLKCAPFVEGKGPSLDAALERSGRVPAGARSAILSACETDIRGGGTADERDAAVFLAEGQCLALLIRRISPGQWMVVLDGSGAATDAEGSHDTLSEPGGRRLFEEKLTEALTTDLPDASPAVVVFDIDRFRQMNDRLGHKGGDALLRAVTGRVRHAIRDRDLAVRLEGDVFAVLQINGQAAEALAIRLVDVLSRPYLIRGEVVTAGISAGVAQSPLDGNSAPMLLKHADYARREAKDAGGQTWRRYGQNMADRARGKAELEADLRKALASGQLSLAYQPKVNWRTHAIVGFEALARWKHPNRGMVPPDLFIPAAEDAGLIGQIGEWVLRTACREAMAWPEPLTVAVNVSARQLGSGQHFVSQVVTALRESGLPTRRLELDVTEAALARRPDDAKVVLRDLHELGVRIALDDFGAGPVSLSWLRTCPFDSVKIGRSLVRSLENSNESGAVVRAIAALGAGLGLAIVAVGVETKTQAMMAVADGCAEIQGYLISRPLPPREAAALIRRDLPADAVTG